VKSQFKIDFDKLTELKDSNPDAMTPEMYAETVQKLKVSEANMLRDVDLKIKDAQNAEQAALRKELEKKHNNEQVQFRADMAKKQGDLRKQLLGDSEII
jgi:hypothetical protein